jgi:hypothetical protein
LWSGAEPYCYGIEKILKFFSVFWMIGLKKG